MGNATVRISRLTRSATTQLAQQLDPLHDYLGMMPAVRKAVSDRAETLLTLQTLLADADAKHARITKLETDISKVGRNPKSQTLHHKPYTLHPTPYTLNPKP